MKLSIYNKDIKVVLSCSNPENLVPPIHSIYGFWMSPNPHTIHHPVPPIHSLYVLRMFNFCLRWNQENEAEKMYGCILTNVTKHNVTPDVSASHKYNIYTELANILNPISKFLARIARQIQSTSSINAPPTLQSTYSQDGPIA